MKQNTVAQRPPQELFNAMQKMRTGDDRAALEIAERSLSRAQDKAPYLAIASLTALRIGEPRRAIPHLRELLAIHPKDRASMVNLASALIETGDLDGAMKLAKDQNHPDLARIEGYIHQKQGDLEAAVVAYSRALATDQNDLASWNNLANVYTAIGSFDQAITAFERAIALAPADIGPYLNLADVLRQADRGEARLKVMQDAKALAPGDRQVLTEYALAQAHVEDLEGAVATLEDVVNRFPEFGESHIELGQLYEVLNRVEGLVALGAKINPDIAPPEAAFLLAWQALREGRFDDAARHAESIPASIHPMRRFHLIGQIAERRGDAGKAFTAFEQMNNAAMADLRPRIGPTYRERVEADLARWTPAWAERWPDPVAGDPGQRDPIFLVGFPRSGTTLLDTMLMGHSHLSVLEERPMMAEVARSLDVKRDEAALANGEVVDLRKTYFDIARRNGWDDARWLVDKHPLNMARAPLILRLFPQAKFILAERHPYDVVLSCFMTNFQPNFAMRSFTSLGEAARTYDAVFSAWERACALLPIKSHAVRYERLVEDQRAELEPLVDWLGLDWDDRLLAHGETARKRGRVRTASYSQISEALYTRARERWHRYVLQLEPVIPILQPWAEKFGYPIT